MWGSSRKYSWGATTRACVSSCDTPVWGSSDDTWRSVGSPEWYSQKPTLCCFLTNPRTKVCCLEYHSGVPVPLFLSSHERCLYVPSFSLHREGTSWPLTQVCVCLFRVLRITPSDWSWQFTNEKNAYHTSNTVARLSRLYCNSGDRTTRRSTKWREREKYWRVNI
jgi:hypothetical protein